MVELQQKMSPEEEIKKLEQQLEQKKRELTESGVAPKEEKEIFREVLKERIESLKPSAPSAPAVPYVPSPLTVAPAAPHDAAADAKKKEEEQAVRALIEKAMTGTIEDAVKEAQKISPYMLDELHDHLVDDFYAKLIALRKIKSM